MYLPTCQVRTHERLMHPNFAPLRHSEAKFCKILFRYFNRFVVVFISLFILRINLLSLKITGRGYEKFLRYHFFIGGDLIQP